MVTDHQFGDAEQDSSDDPMLPPATLPKGLPTTLPQEGLPATLPQGLPATLQVDTVASTPPQNELSSPPAGGNKFDASTAAAQMQQIQQLQHAKLYPVFQMPDGSSSTCLVPPQQMNHSRACMNVASLGQYPIPSSLENGGGVLPSRLVAADLSSLWIRSQVPPFLSMPSPQRFWSNSTFALAQGNQQLFLRSQLGMRTPQQQLAQVMTQPITQPITQPMGPRVQQGMGLLVPPAIAQARPVTTGLTYRPPTLLFMECDRDTLSEYQCLVRQQIELFEAEMDSIKGKAQGRNTPILLGQVGIRCKHCALLPLGARPRGAVYFSQSVSGIYQAAQNMAEVHLSSRCHQIPDDIKRQLKALRQVNKRAFVGKQYWTVGVQALGIYEEDRGVLRFDPNFRYAGATA